jgi:tetratricopeptide (TPR) repeat protein
VNPQHAHIASILNNLGELYLNQERYAEAEKVLRRAFEIRISTFGPESSAVAEVLLNQADLARRLKRKREAKKLERRARVIQAQQFRRSLSRNTIDVAALRAEK